MKIVEDCGQVKHLLGYFFLTAHFRLVNLAGVSTPGGAASFALFIAWTLEPRLG